MLSYSNLNISLVSFSQVCSITFMNGNWCTLLICWSIKDVILKFKDKTDVIVIVEAEWVPEMKC